jgi:hypothetical protein
LSKGQCFYKFRDGDHDVFLKKVVDVIIVL